MNRFSFLLACLTLFFSISAFADLNCKATKYDNNGGAVDLPLAPESTNGIPGLYEDAVVYINAADMSGPHTPGMISAALDDKATKVGASATGYKYLNLVLNLSDGDQVNLTCTLK